MRRYSQSFTGRGISSIQRVERFIGRFAAPTAVNSDKITTTPSMDIAFMLSLLFLFTIQYIDCDTNNNRDYI